MSHFTVMVVGDDVEGQLAPYQENNMGTCPKEYMEFKDEEDHYRKKFEEESEDYVVLPNGTTVPAYDSSARSLANFDELPKVQKPYKEIYSSFEDFAEQYAGIRKDPEIGRFGYWTNPNCKWDWWVIGGRWSGYFKLKKGVKPVVGQSGVFDNKPKPGWADQCRKGDIDYNAMILETVEEAEKAWNESEQVDGPNQKDTWYWNYGRKDTDTKETYVKRRASFATYAVVMNGQWYQKGEMGWFGVSRDEKKSADWEAEFMHLFESLPDDTLLTVVDCHI